MSDLAPTPPVGRAPKRVNLDGTLYEVHPLSPRAALRVGFRLVKVVGDPIAGLLSGAGLEVPGFKDDEGNPINLKFAHLLTSARAREALLGQLVSKLADVDPDDLDALVLELLVGQVHQHAMNGVWLPADDADVLDNMIAPHGLMGLITLLQNAMVVSLFPTSAGSDTSAVSQPAAT